MNVKLNDLINIYENEVKKNVKNKQKIFNFEKQKMEYLCDIKRVLDNDLYDGGKYNIFLIYEPKIRVIMSQGIYDKIINHYVTRFILEPKLSKYLEINNCATRKNMGTNYALQLFKKEIEKFKKYDIFYFLKLDISKYFYRINHDVLKSLLLNDLNEKYKLKINEKKTFISSSKGGITFLRYLFKIKNKKTIIKITNIGKRNIRKGIKRTRYLYNIG